MTGESGELMLTLLPLRHSPVQVPSSVRACVTLLGSHSFCMGLSCVPQIHVFRSRPPVPLCLEAGHSAGHQG